LLAAALTVAVRETVVRRQRRDAARRIDEDLELAQSAIRPLIENLDQVRAIAARRWADPKDTWEFRFDSSLLRNLFQRWDYPESTLLRLAAEYGTVDFVPLLQRIRTGQESLQPAIDAALAAIDELKKDQDSLYWEADASPSETSVKCLNSALQMLEKSVDPVLADAVNLMNLLERAYPPSEYADQRVRRPLPGWVFVTTMALAALAGVAWLASWLAPHCFPPGFAADILGNALAGLVVAFIAWAVGVVAAYHRRREVIGLAKFWYNNLTEAINVVFAFSQDDFTGDRRELAPNVASITTQSVSQLENIIPDARLMAYAQQFLRSLQDFAAGKFDLAQDVHPDVIARLGLPQRPPTPRGLRMIEEAGRLGQRAADVYIFQCHDTN